MSTKHPAAVAAFLAQHAQQRRTFYGAIDSYDHDEHAVSFDWNAAANVLAGEDDFDATKYVALGFLNDDVPLFVGGKAAAVYAFLDGERTRIAASFTAFLAQLEPPAAKAKASASKTKTTGKPAPEPLAGPAVVPWPDDAVVSCRFGQALDTPDFLWFERVSPKANNDVMLHYLKPQGFRTGFTVGKKWDAAATMSWDRGTGVVLDFSCFERRTPVVTARVREFLLEVQPDTLEFLPVRAKIGKLTADLFIVNVTLAVACLDTQVVTVPDASVVFPYRLPSPQSLTTGQNALAVVADKVPSMPAFFRPAEYPEAILANRAMVDRLRSARFSGLNFLPLERQSFD